MQKNNELGPQHKAMRSGQSSANTPASIGQVLRCIRFWYVFAASKYICNANAMSIKKAVACGIFMLSRFGQH